MRSLFITLTLLGTFSIGKAQLLPDSLASFWTNPGFDFEALTPANTIDVTDSGLVGDGITPNDAAMLSILSFLGNELTVVYFPTGNYLFNAPITMTPNTILKGAGADSTQLIFDLGGAGDAIRIWGSSTKDTTWLSDAGNMDEAVVTSATAGGIDTSSYYLLQMDDADLVNDWWAEGQVAQIVKPTGISGNDIFIKSSLRLRFPMVRRPRLLKMNMIENVGIECLKIRRNDVTAGQFCNIDYMYAANAWVHAIESEYCNYSHIRSSWGTNITVRGSYFHNAYDFGGGGKAYGVALWSSSGEFLVENNVFRRLRHSMLLQSGSNGNVFGYNYSTDPYRSSFPTNWPGEITLHGNYPFSNLFEGNDVGNIIIDASHDINGPYNAIFRNRATITGFAMSTPASDRQIIAGNEIGGLGLYAISGTGHIEYGNNVSGTTRPSGTDDLQDTSLYLKSKPDFLNNYVWPAIGYPNSLEENTIPAGDRFADSIFTLCDYTFIPDTLAPPIDTSSTDTTSISEINSFHSNGLVIVPNPNNGDFEVRISSSQQHGQVIIYDLKGSIIHHQEVTSDTFRVDGLESGLYFLRWVTNDGILVRKVLVER